MSWWLAVALLFLVLATIFKVNAPRCWTCGKRKASMHLTDKLDCLKCTIERERSKS